MAEHYYLAIDLGAESGRVVLGRLAGEQLSLEEIHRFPNGAIKIAGTLRWDVVRIFEELKVGLRKAASRHLPIASVSVDSWGLDYVLIGAGQPMLSLPFSYRDARCDRPFAAMHQAPGRETVFAETGIQFLPINTLYQLIAEQETSPGLVALSERFLMIADYFHYLLSGVAVAEESLASTSQLYHPSTRQWSEKLIEIFQLPRRIFPPVVVPGSQLGPLLPELRTETGLGESVKVIATCSHDTGAAVVAVPAEGEDWAYLSSGTWSLIGVELPAPELGPAALRYNFTNEAGFGGTTRFLKNIVGLWLLQECRRSWSLQGHEYNYGTLSMQAEHAEPFRSLVNPADPRFLKPDDMPGKIAAYCRETGQPVPETPGQFTRCIYESLALLYRRTLGEIENATGRQIRRLHIVGGGSQSAVLNQFAANATGRPVLAGPVEATALGNVLIQAITLGHLPSLATARHIVGSSASIVIHEPRDREAWEAVFARFSHLPGGNP